MNTNKTTMQLIEELPQETKDDFIELLAQDAQCFKNMNTHPELSYSNWFRTFVVSEDFIKMDNDQQKEVFKHYENSVHAIRVIAEFFYENEVINYRDNLHRVEIQ